MFQPDANGMPSLQCYTVRATYYREAGLGDVQQQGRGHDHPGPVACEGHGSPHETVRASQSLYSSDSYSEGKLFMSSDVRCALTLTFVDHREPHRGQCG